MGSQRIYVDLNKWEEVDGEFRVILTPLGTYQDLQKYNVTLEEGLVLDLWMDDENHEGNSDPLYFQGVVQYSESAQNWVAVVDRSKIHSASELQSDISTIKAHGVLEPARVG